MPVPPVKNFKGELHGPEKRPVQTNPNRQPAVDVTRFSGKTAGERIAAAIATLPDEGGIVNALGLYGTQTIASDVLSGLTKPCQVWLGEATYEVNLNTHSLTIGRNQSIIGHNTIIRSIAAGVSGWHTNAGILETKQNATTGSIKSGNDQLTVANSSGIEIGDVIAIEGAQGGSEYQEAILSSGIDANDTTIPVDGTANFPRAGTLLIASEVIQYTSTDGTHFLGATRGALGTSAASHSSGAALQLMHHLRATVEDISGNIVTLDTAASLSVSTAEVLSGVQHPALNGTLTIDGRQNRAEADPANNIIGIVSTLSRFLYIGPDVQIINCDHCAVLLESSYDASVRGRYAGNGRPGDGLGADVFIFRGSKRCDVRPTSMVDGNIAAFIDDRTQSANKLDGSSENNFASLPPITSHKIAVEISSCQIGRAHV